MGWRRAVQRLRTRPRDWRTRARWEWHPTSLRSSPIHLDVWDATFSGQPHPGELWWNSAHPSKAAYEAINDLLAAAIPDPGQGTVAVLGDSWGVGAQVYGLRATMEAAWGHEVPWIDAAVSGNTHGQMLARFDTDIAPHDPVLVIDYSGWANDVAQARSAKAAAFDVRRLRAACDWLGATLVMLGVGPSSDHPKDSAAMRARVYEAATAP